jgi:hypothetical protein
MWGGVVTFCYTCLSVHSSYYCELLETEKISTFLSSTEYCLTGRWFSIITSQANKTHLGKLNLPFQSKNRALFRYSPHFFPTTNNRTRGRAHTLYVLCTAFSAFIATWICWGPWIPKQSSIFVFCVTGSLLSLPHLNMHQAVSDI